MTTTHEKITGAKEWLSPRNCMHAHRINNVVCMYRARVIDESGKIPIPRDFAKEARQIFNRPVKRLFVVGGSCDDNVQAHVFFATPDNFKSSPTVMSQLLKTSQPTFTEVIVASRQRKDVLIKISAVAELLNPLA
jgi:hypothetical protein